MLQNSPQNEQFWAANEFVPQERGTRSYVSCWGQAGRAAPCSLSMKALLLLSIFAKVPLESRNWRVRTKPCKSSPLHPPAFAIPEQLLTGHEKCMSWRKLRQSSRKLWSLMWLFFKQWHVLYYEEYTAVIKVVVFNEITKNHKSTPL